ncbi:MAG: hypothetical protein R6V83_14020 [Candidatus Thorarchaeota archaeon]
MPIKRDGKDDTHYGPRSSYRKYYIIAESEIEVHWFVAQASWGGIDSGISLIPMSMKQLGVTDLSSGVVWENPSLWPKSLRTCT